MSVDQSQNAGGGSINQQAGRDIIIKGISYTDVREISRDIMRQEIEVATAAAVEDMRKDIALLSEKIAEKMEESGVSPDVMANPSVQLLVHDVQRKIIESEAAEESDFSISLLIKNLGQNIGTSRARIFREATKIAPLLDKSLVQYLSVVFAVYKTSYSFSLPQHVIGLKRTAELHLSRRLKVLRPVIDGIERKRVDIQYLEMLGLINNIDGLQHYKSPIFIAIENIFEHSKSFFSEAEKKEAIESGISEGAFISPKLGDDEFYLVEAPIILDDFTDFNVESGEMKERISQDVADRWRNLANRQPSNKEKGIISEIVREDAIMQRLEKEHNDKLIGTHVLSPIGVALAISYLKHEGQQLDESIWFPD